MYKKINAYFSKHVMYTSFVHAVAGMGLGILITYPYVGTHPVRVGVGLLALGTLGHLYPLFASKK